LSSDYSPSSFDPTTNQTIKNTAGTYAELLFTTKSGVGWVYGSAAPTGLEKLLFLIKSLLFS